MVDYNRATANLTDQGTWPRWISFLIGIWLIISAFVWPHTASARTNTWILGVLIAIAAMWAMWTPSIRFLNTLFAIWLFFATLVIHHTQPGTVWNNLIAAVVVFVLSLIPSRAAPRRPGGHHPVRA